MEEEINTWTYDIKENNKNSPVRSTLSTCRPVLTTVLKHPVTKESQAQAQLTKEGEQLC
jgi:hypothetical protein